MHTALAQVREGEGCVVDAIGEVGYGDGADQLYDLLFGKVLAHGGEIGVTDGHGGAGYLVGKMNDGFFLFVEESGAFVEGEPLDLLRGDTDPLRRSGVGFGSILARVDGRGL